MSIVGSIGIADNEVRYSFQTKGRFKIDKIERFGSDRWIDADKKTNL